MKIGIGTYSFSGFAGFIGLGPALRDQFQSAKNLGFERVELLAADLYNDQEDLKRWLAETGLEVSSVHSEPSEEVIKKLAAIGGKAVIWGGTDFANKAEALEVAEILQRMAEFAEPYGVKVAYHNHSAEFNMEDGVFLLEHLLDNCPKCYLQLDCGWTMNAGMYPPSVIRKYKNRVISVHVKENDKVYGPGVARSRHAGGDSHPLFAKNVMDLPAEERQRLLDDFAATLSTADEGGMPMNNQCKMGAPESNINWKEIKKALDEQDFEAFWVVEREGFYDEHDKCLAEDCQWLKENIR